MSNWITSSPSDLFMVAISGMGIYIALLIYTRLAGLRSFSKMSSFDFAITIALGSVIASTLLSSTPSLLTGAFGLGVLFTIQYLVSKSRTMNSSVGDVVDNVPLLIMSGGNIHRDNLSVARMTEDDLKSKLREAGITHPNQVFAVVFETTGSVSVLESSDDIDPWIFSGMRGEELLNYQAASTAP